MIPGVGRMERSSQTATGKIDRLQGLLIVMVIVAGLIVLTGIVSLSFQLPIEIE